MNIYIYIYTHSLLTPSKMSRLPPSASSQSEGSSLASPMAMAAAQPHPAYRFMDLGFGALDFS